MIVEIRYLFIIVLLGAFFGFPIQGTGQVERGRSKSYSGELTKNQAEDEVLPRIWKIDFRGNTSFNTLVLRDVIASEPAGIWKKLVFWKPSGPKYYKTELQKDSIRLKRFYNRRGFDDASIDYSVTEANKYWKKIITFVINEGKPIIIDSVRYKWKATPSNIKHMQAFPSIQKILNGHAFQKGKRYQRVKTPDVKGRITKAFRNEGYAFADIGVNARVDTVKNRAHIQISIEPGPVAYIDSIDVEGEYTVNRSLIRRNSGLHRGVRFSEHRLTEAQRELFNHPLFQFATISVPEQAADSTLRVLIRVREDEKRSIGARIGLGREDLLRGQVSWVHRNVARLGHKFSTSLRASFIEQKVSVNYLLPYIFNEKSSIVISPFAHHLLEPNYELYQAGINNTLIYRYSKDLTGSISYVYTRNHEDTRNEFVDLPDSTRAYDVSSIQLSGYYNRGFKREKGWVFRPYAEFSGLIGTASFPFNKFFLDVRRYFQLSSTLVAAARVTSGVIHSPAVDSLPNNIRYYAGGTNSVRGWKRNMLGPKRTVLDQSDAFKQYVPLGGKVQLTFNMELRQRLDFFIKDLGMALFVDGGQVWPDIYSTEMRPLQFSAGGGFRYNSPIGPVRVDVGYKLNPTPKDLNIYRGDEYGGRLDRMAIHFSVGKSF